jgi:hypothetical protein
MANEKSGARPGPALFVRAILRRVAAIRQRIASMIALNVPLGRIAAVAFVKSGA